MTRWIKPLTIHADTLTALQLHPLVSQTLIRRGISDPNVARAFLDPDLYAPHSAEHLPGMVEAVERVLLAIRKRETICIWGDFDVDGQTSTTLLYQTLRALQANLTYYIPVRARESHGLHIPKLQQLIDNGAQLILTCDTGITAHAAVDYANSRGVDVVITDHHDPGESLPNATAITNPKLLPAGHPLSTLPGVGVAYKFAELLLARCQDPSVPIQPEDLLDLVALGIVADVAELRGDTRYLLQKGLQHLRHTNRLGLRTIYRMANLQAANLSEEHIGFRLGPRLNAIGRLGDANPIVDLLTTDNPAQANVLASQLEGLNAHRQLLTRQVYAAAQAQLQEDASLLEHPVIVLANPHWPGGVIGITASKLVEKYGKPVILLNAPEGELARGSARSIDGVHITEAIAAQKDLLAGFGGHPMAAGLALENRNIPEFRKRIGQTVQQMLGQAYLSEPQLPLDAWLSLSEINFELVSALEVLAPFGAGNPPLTLATRNLLIKNAAAIGRTQEHVKMTVADSAENTQTVLWWNGDLQALPEAGSRIDLAYKVRTSDYQGVLQIQLELIDFRLVEEKLPDRRRKTIKVIDLRAENQPVFSKDSLIFVEGEHKKRLNGVDRYHLRPAKTLALYTAPPGSAILRAVLEQVQPETVYLIGESPAAGHTPEAFLQHLAGLVKFALNHKNGKTTLPELAAATAQRELTVQLGLEWLAAGGHVGIEYHEHGLLLRPGETQTQPDLQKELFCSVNSILEETRAFRKYFSSCPAEKLISGQG